MIEAVERAGGIAKSDDEAVIDLQHVCPPSLFLLPIPLISSACLACLPKPSHVSTSAARMPPFSPLVILSSSHLFFVTWNFSHSPHHPPLVRVDPL